MGGRKVVGNITLSLDGRTTGPDGEYDMTWIVPHAISSASRDNLAAITATATTAVLGRKNYEGFSSFWPDVAENESMDLRDREFSRWLTRVEKVVFSSTLKEATWENSRIVSGDPAAVIAEVKQQPGGDIVVLASQSLIRELLRAGRLDRLSITLCPELVGGGASLFDDIPASSWTLTQSTPTETGALCLIYDRAA